MYVGERYYYYLEKDEMNIGPKDWREIIEYKTTNIASGFIAAIL